MPGKTTALELIKKIREEYGTKTSEELEKEFYEVLRDAFINPDEAIEYYKELFKDVKGEIRKNIFNDKIADLLYRDYLRGELLICAIMRAHVSVDYGLDTITTVMISIARKMFLVETLLRAARHLVEDLEDVYEEFREKVSEEDRVLIDLRLQKLEEIESKINEVIKLVIKAISTFIFADVAANVDKK